MKVVFILPIIPHYRKFVVHELLKSETFQTYFITSKKYLTNTSVNFDNKRVFDKFNYWKFQLGEHIFYWLKDATAQLKAIDPDVIVLTGFDPHMLHLQWIFLKYRFFSKKKILWWSQGTIGEQGFIGKWIRAFFYKRADGILAYSKDSRRNLLEMGVKDKNIKVVNNSIPKADYGFLNFPIIDFKKSIKIDNKIKLISVGKLTYIKRLDLLIDAVYLLKEKGERVECHIVGDGVHMEELRVKVDKLSLKEEICLHGSKYGEALDELFLYADIYVLPGSVGLSIVHAFSYGLPLITTMDKSVHSPEVELLHKGENGDFFQGTNVESLALKIEEWHGKIKYMRQEIARACIESIRVHGYLPEEMTNNIISYINEFKNN